MASIQLTQVYLTSTTPATSPPTLFIVQGSESFIAINPLSLDAVGPVYQQDGSLVNVRMIYVNGNFMPIYVTDSYATVKAYIDAL
tara:strand:+ start:944 stop:1198 length:255 start_codon:yes stop_codon:yes gene_type:complete